MRPFQNKAMVKHQIYENILSIQGGVISVPEYSISNMDEAKSFNSTDKP